MGVLSWPTHLLLLLPSVLMKQPGNIAFKEGILEKCQGPKAELPR